MEKKKKELPFFWQDTPGIVQRCSVLDLVLPGVGEDGYSRFLQTTPSDGSLWSFCEQREWLPRKTSEIAQLANMPDLVNAMAKDVMAKPWYSVVSDTTNYRITNKLSPILACGRHFANNTNFCGGWCGFIIIRFNLPFMCEQLKEPRWQLVEVMTNDTENKKSSNRLICCNLCGDNCSIPHTHERSKVVWEKKMWP